MTYALVVDLESSQAQLPVSILSELGVTVVTAREGDSARRVLRERGAPRLLVTELALPGLDGFGLVRALRVIDPSVPVVIRSAFRELRRHAQHQTRELNLYGIIASHAPPSMLRSVLRSALAGIRVDAAPEPPEAVLAAAERHREGRVQALGLDEERRGDSELGQIAADTAASFGVQAALVSVAMHDRHWFKASAGLRGRLLADRGAPRDCPFFRWVIESAAPLCVPDAVSHPLLSTDPYVLDGTIRGFVGVPLVMGNGDVVGTVSLFDPEPLALGSLEIDGLRVVAERLAGLMSLDRPTVSSPSRSGSPVPLESVLQHLDVGMVLFDHERQLVVANQAMALMIGLPVGEILRLTWGEWVAHLLTLFDAPNEFIQKVQSIAPGPIVARAEFETTRPRRRVVRWYAEPIRLPDGIGRLDVFTDITAERDLVLERDRLARVDALTNLANRRGAEEAMNRMVSRANRDGSPLSLAILDVDHFKRVNDTFGHAAGDEVLRALAVVLQRTVREGDMAARWGGEEFLALLPTAALEGAQIVAERVRVGVENAALPGIGRVTLSAGVAQLRPNEKALDLVGRADEALYRAKMQGRNRVMTG